MAAQSETERKAAEEREKLLKAEQEAIAEAAQAAAESQAVQDARTRTADELRAMSEADPPSGQPTPAGDPAPLNPDVLSEEEREELFEEAGIVTGRGPILTSDGQEVERIDVTVEGGRYRVGGVWVDANGNQVKAPPKTRSSK